MLYSKKSQEIGVASSIEQNELVYKKRREGGDPIILSYGEAPFKISPILSKESDWERGCHYSEGKGVPEFRQEIAKYIKDVTDVEISWEKNILVSAGSKIISYFIAQALLNPGDNIMLHEPSWVSYQEHAKLNQASTTFLDYTRSVYDFEDLYKSHPNTKLIYLNNPNNPRGYVYSEKELRWLANFCADKNIVLAIDESYSDFVIDEDFYSGIILIKDFPNVVVFNSISKNFGLSGWRIGYCVGSEDFINRLNKFNQHLITCAPTCLQLDLVGKLSTLRAEIGPQLKALNSKRSDVIDLLQKFGFKYLSGSSTFYVFIDVSHKVNDTKQFAVEFLEKSNVSLIPGGAYGESTSGFLRLSFAIEPIDRIELALTRLHSALND
ncbi:pyridoxal phosphate-dependent aminotransferase [Polynucleobacter alcilacus]|uniref:pyridoxal phosphate-dependent aminotransferase n=1 Tax=Polynucleobacter alcilacus TaxID=1819739 RepID=UPI001C0C0D14|nr:pyridoxal phosphate-dependent aminotransferase [Polynucleobacter alcilacus]